MQGREIQEFTRNLRKMGSKMKPWEKPKRPARQKVKRPHMPKAVKLESRRIAGEKCGCGCGEPLPPFGTSRGCVYDHRPPLMNRPWDEKAGDYSPPANDPKFIRPLLPACDKRITFGPGGTRRITTRGGDIGEKAHETAMGEKHDQFRAAMNAKKPGKSRKASGRIPSRPFPTSKRGFGNRGK